MTNPPTLPISRLVTVTVDLSPQPAQAQNLSTLLILGSSDVIDVVERQRTYTSIDEVVADFGTALPEYSGAVLYFEQAPQPASLKIGRWAATDTQGKLNCGPLAPANQPISAWNLINNGGFVVDINGIASPVAGLDFTGTTNLNGVATVIQAALAGATCIYNASQNRFEIESVATGPTSTISFLSAGAGTDISGMLNGLGQPGDGSYVANGIAAETALAAVTLFDEQFGQTWYAVTVLGAVDSDHEAIGPFIESADNKHLYGVSTQEAGVLSSVVTTDIASLMQALKLSRSIVQYSGSNPYSVCSLFGRALTVDYNGQNTVITLKFKQEPGIVPENITSTQADALEAKNCNVFVAYNDGTAILEQGVTCNGDYIDELTGTDWLAVTIMAAIYNLMITLPTKIPQTDDGIHLLTNVIESVCSQGVSNGLLAPGVWTSGGFGTLATGDLLPKGFYVFAPPVASQSAADRAARKAPSIKVAAKLAGAVHSADLAIEVNR